MAAPAGYSGKPLALKLGIKPGVTIVTIGAPRGYRALLGTLPRGARIARGGAGRGLHAFVHCFTTKRQTLEAQLPRLERSLAPTGMLWISWPKGTSGVATDVTENVVREIGLATGLVDVKVCAVDATWSGLKFVRRVKDR